jgi:hypothetical protein
LEITLPTIAVKLSGKGSDVDGTILHTNGKNLWAGSIQYRFLNKAETVVTGLVREFTSLN